MPPKLKPPKKPSFSTLTSDAPARLATLRKTAGAWLTQEKLAELCGCSRVTIRAAENGERTLTSDLAGRIGVATGVCPFWLSYGICQAKFMESGVGALQVAAGDPKRLLTLQSKTPLQPNGEPFTPETFKQRKAVSGKEAPNELHISELLLADDIALVLRAAAGCQKLPGVVHAISSALREAVEKFQLENHVHSESTDGMDLDTEERAMLLSCFPVGEAFALRDAIRHRKLAQYREDMLSQLKLAAGVIKVITDRLLDPAGDHIHLGDIEKAEGTPKERSPKKSK